MKRIHGIIIGLMLSALASSGPMACGAANSEAGDRGAGKGAGILSKQRIVAKAMDRDEAFTWPDSPTGIVSLRIRNHGTIRIGLYAQLAPKTVAHFLDLARRGVYDDTLFHRVIKDFMIQGGDPKTRKRGPGSTKGKWGSLKVEDEFNDAEHLRGVVSMANRGVLNSAASEFFIVHKDTPSIDGSYTAFGRVLSGMEIVDKIAETETDEFGRWGAKLAPIDPVILVEAHVDGEIAASVDSRSAVVDPAG
jgi:peptidyl-prolyl cis-trans isomerase B (cyclophilin B)